MIGMNVTLELPERWCKWTLLESPAESSVRPSGEMDAVDRVVSKTDILLSTDALTVVDRYVQLERADSVEYLC